MGITYSSRGKAKPDIETTHDLTVGATAVDITVTPDLNFRLVAVTGHADDTVNSALTVSILSKESTGAGEYDTVLHTVSTGWTDFAYSPDEELLFEVGDSIQVDCANGVGADIGIRVVLEVL